MKFTGGVKKQKYLICLIAPGGAPLVGTRCQ